MRYQGAGLTRDLPASLLGQNCSTKGVRNVRWFLRKANTHENAHVGARGRERVEATNDATNEKRPRPAASWAICGVSGLRLGGELAAFGFHESASVAFDSDRNPVILFPTEWAMNYFVQTNPQVAVSSLPQEDAPAGS